MDVPKASDVLARELREQILTGTLSEGDSLPPERDLVQQTGMSRTTVREALRILEVQGLIRVKTGRAGGAFVQRPGTESVATSLGILIRGQRIRLAAVHEARAAIEPSCARLAATNHTDDDLTTLNAANAAMAADGPLEEFLQANLDWHVGVATASHNEILSGTMLALSRAIYTSTHYEGFVDDEIRRVTARAHRSVTNAIKAGDADAAERRMARHVHRYAQLSLDVDEREAISLDE